LLFRKKFFIEQIGAMRVYAACGPLRVSFWCVKYIAVNRDGDIERGLTPVQETIKTLKAKR
jgi:hypothetical protein